MDGTTQHSLIHTVGATVLFHCTKSDSLFTLAVRCLAFRFKRAYIVTLLALLFVAVPLSATPKTTLLELVAGHELNRLPSAFRATLNSAMDAIARQDWNSLYRLSSPDVRARMDEAAFISTAQMVARVTGDVSELSVDEVHLFQPNADARGPDGFYRSSPVPSHVFRSTVRLAVPSIENYAIVVGSAKSANQQLLWLTILFEEASDAWPLVSWYFNPREGNGHDGYWFADEARRFESNGQARNAHFFRVLARQLLVTSSYVISSEAESLSIELTAKEPGNMPFPGLRPGEKWQTSENEAVEVYFVAPVALGVVLAVEVRFTSDLADLESEEAHRQRERLAEYVKHTFPEYRDAFDGIFVGSTLVTGKAFRDYFPFDP